MVNQAHIEGVFLASRRADGDDILLSTGRGGVAWCADGYLVKRFPFVHIFDHFSQAYVAQSVVVEVNPNLLGGSSPGSINCLLVRTLVRTKGIYYSNIACTLLTSPILRQWLDKLASAEANLKDITRKLTDLRDASRNLTEANNRLSVRLVTNSPCRNLY
jgi:hypothetical protein